MPRAIWNNRVIAEAPAGEVHRVEGNAYFPLSAVKHEFLRASDTHTHCFWKGTSYYDVVVEGKVNDDAAWYSNPPAWRHISRITSPSGMARKWKNSRWIFSNLPIHHTKR